jgi:very-short-patch-repair endonuclease
MSWSRLYDHACRQRGVVDVRWGPKVGLHPATILARARRERWRNPYEHVFLLPGAPWDHRTDLLAAQTACRADAAARGPSAAWLYGLARRPPVRPHLLLPHHQRVRIDVGFVRRSRHLRPDDMRDVDGIVVLTPTFWLISQAPDSTDDHLLALAIDARQRRLFVYDEVTARLTTMPRVPGRARLVRVLRRLAADGSDSVFEARVRERVLAAGLVPSAAPVAVPTVDGRTVYLDIAFPAERVAIECIGYMAHSTREQLNRDARRENAIARTGGWLVLKLTWDRFLHDWDGFLAELRHALGRHH